MPLVVGGIVDQNRDRSQFFLDRANRGAKRCNIGHVAFAKGDVPALFLQFLDQRLGRVHIDVEKRDPRPLAGKLADGFLADTQGAACNQDNTIL